MIDQVRPEVCVLRDAGDGHQSEHCYRLLSQLHCLHCPQVRFLGKCFVLLGGLLPLSSDQEILNLGINN